MFIGNILNITTTAIYTRCNIIFFANNNIKLSFHKMQTSVGDTFIRILRLYGQVWNNSATLTSMKFTGNFDVGTNIQLWSKR